MLRQIAIAIGCILAYDTNISLEEPAVLLKDASPSCNLHAVKLLQGGNHVAVG
jgi:hypothetical protein